MAVIRAQIYFDNSFSAVEISHPLVSSGDTESWSFKSRSLKRSLQRWMCTIEHKLSEDHLLT